MGDGWWVFNTLVHRGLSIHEKALVSYLLLDVMMQQRQDTSAFSCRDWESNPN